MRRVGQVDGHVAVGSLIERRVQPGFPFALIVGGRLVGTAYTIGYMKALLARVNAEA